MSGICNSTCVSERSRCHNKSVSESSRCNSRDAIVELSVKTVELLAQDQDVEIRSRWSNKMASLTILELLQDKDIDQCNKEILEDVGKYVLKQTEEHAATFDAGTFEILWT